MILYFYGRLDVKNYTEEHTGSEQEDISDDDLTDVTS